MKRALIGPMIALTIVLHTASSAAADNLEAYIQKRFPVPKGYLRYVIKSDSDARKIFDYFPYPAQSDFVAVRSIWRLTLTTSGSVSDVKPLMTTSPWGGEIAVQNKLRQWRAKPGSLRVVDIAFSYTSRNGSTHRR